VRPALLGFCFAYSSVSVVSGPVGDQSRSLRLPDGSATANIPGLWSGSYLSRCQGFSFV
jgi:hypothetical protein